MNIFFQNYTKIWPQVFEEISKMDYLRWPDQTSQESLCTNTIAAFNHEVKQWHAVGQPNSMLSNLLPLTESATVLRKDTAQDRKSRSCITRALRSDQVDKLLKCLQLLKRRWKRQNEGKGPASLSLSVLSTDSIYVCIYVKEACHTTSTLAFFW